MSKESIEDSVCEEIYDNIREALLDFNNGSNSHIDLSKEYSLCKLGSWFSWGSGNKGHNYWNGIEKLAYRYDI